MTAAERVRAQTHDRAHLRARVRSEARLRAAAELVRAQTRNRAQLRAQVRSKARARVEVPDDRRPGTPAAADTPAEGGGDRGAAAAGAATSVGGR